MKKAISILLVLCFALAMFAGCGSSANSSGSSAANSAPAQTAGDSGTAEASASLPEKTGTIMWLSNLTSGPQYEVYKAYGEAICDQLGYNFTIVYGDTFNDAAGNLTAVTNGMTNDVVGLLASQDGGLSSIMEQYPNLYVAGFASDMLSVFGEGRENAGVLNNDHFLGTVCDGFSHGVDIGNQYFEATLQKGYHRVSLVTFPAFAYPALAEAVVQYQARVDEYNATAADADKITVVGEPLTLEFQPLADSYFLEDGKDDLDAIIAFCAGVQFVYPILATAKINGTCDPRTQVVTSGFDDNKDIVADIGDGKTIAWISISPCENIGYALLKKGSVELGDVVKVNNRYDAIITPKKHLA